MRGAWRRAFLAGMASAVWLVPAIAYADINFIRQQIGNAELVGTSRLHYLLWDIYDAELYAPGGKWDDRSPFALTLTYLHDFKGKTLAEYSIKEMRKLGFDDEAKLARWQAQLETVFPDVARNDELTGVRDANGTTRFYRNGHPLGVILDAEFTRHFFDIWLSPNTSAPHSRAKLLGLASQ